MWDVSSTLKCSCWAVVEKPLSTNIQPMPCKLLYMFRFSRHHNSQFKSLSCCCVLGNFIKGAKLWYDHIAGLGVREGCSTGLYHGKKDMREWSYWQSYIPYQAESLFQEICSNFRWNQTKVAYLFHLYTQSSKTLFKDGNLISCLWILAIVLATAALLCCVCSS